MNKEIKKGNLNYDQSGRAYPDNPQIKENWDCIWEFEGNHYKLVGDDEHKEWEIDLGMEQLTRKLTAKQIYDNYINDPTTEDTFKLFYTRKLNDGVELKAQQFSSKDEDYCISLLESIMDQEDFLGWPFGDKVTK